MSVEPMPRSAVLLVAVAYASGIAALPWLPGAYLDLGPSWLAASALALLLPSMGLAILVTIQRALGDTGSDEPDAASVGAVRTIVVWTAAFVLALHWLVLGGVLSILDGQGWLPRAVVVLVGVALAGIGNVIPRLRPNLAFGLRTPRLLSDSASWMAVHRVAGYAAVALGLGAIVAGVRLGRATAPLALEVILVIGAVAVARAYWQRRGA